MTKSWTPDQVRGDGKRIRRGDETETRRGDDKGMHRSDETEMRRADAGADFHRRAELVEARGAGTNLSASMPHLSLLTNITI